MSPITANPVPVDLPAFQMRSHAIGQARAKALVQMREAQIEADEERIKEGEADSRYRKLRAQALSYYRIKEDMGVTEAQIMADGSEKVVEAKLEHHMAWSLRRAAEGHVESIREEISLLERNAASLRTEANLSEQAA